MSLKSVCVFCGASPGARPIYHEAAAQLGRHIAERGLTLVYGGGAVGLMGVVADAALAAGGEVIGIIPQSLERAEIGHKGLTRLEVVDGMHARKARMAELKGFFPAGVDVDALPKPLTNDSFSGLPAEQQPTIRTFTVRDADPVARELTIDFAIHGPTGSPNRRAESETLWSLIDGLFNAGDATPMPSPAGSTSPEASRQRQHS